MKKIFVIMPFVKANERDKPALTKFFNDYIKEPIEGSTKLANSYQVTRSGDALSILEKIITDLASADIVICDLSGELSNPNVVYELGIRLSTSHKPVILIREESTTNKHIFDIGGLYTHLYQMTATRDLEKFLIDKISSYEKYEEHFESPVLKTLNHQAAFWMLLPIRKASAFLGGIASAADAQLKAFSKAARTFSAKNGIEISVTDSYTTIYKNLQKLEPKDIEKLQDFDYKISTIPSLDSYLSSVYLLGLIDDSIEKKFREFAMAYSLNFNKGNSFLFSKSKHDEYLSYAYETLILMNISRLIIKILNSRQDKVESKMDLENFSSQLENSHILEE